MNKEETFNKIVADNDQRIHRICRYYNSDPEDRKDMYQEILINIWKSLDSFRGDSTVNTWVYRVAVNTSLSFTGKTFNRMKLMIPFEAKYLNLITNNEYPESIEDKEARFEQLQNELNLLSVIDKALISLMLEGLCMREIADIIGITEPNVKVKIHRIKSHLKEKLNNKNYEK